MTFILVGFAAAVGVLLIYIRVAPSKARDWHEIDLPQLGVGQFPADSGFVEQRLVVNDGMAEMALLDKIIRVTPRTVGFVGTLESGKMTYITRTAIIGFPDYTTVSVLRNEQSGRVVLQVFGRLRFGRKDFGVNRKRITGWLAQLDAQDGMDTPTP